MVTERVGAIVAATGATPYDASKLTHLGFGQCANVVTNATIEELALKGKITRPSDGQPVKSAAFVLCAGSRDPEHLSYCSSTCCIESLKQAKYLRLQDQDAKAYIIYKDMRTPGHYEYFYKSMQEDEGMFLTKGEVSSVSEDASKNVILEVDDSLLGEKIQLKVDMLVLATGMVTAAAIGEEVELGLEDDETCLPTPSSSQTCSTWTTGRGLKRRPCPADFLTHTSFVSRTSPGGPEFTMRVVCGLPWTGPARLTMLAEPRSRQSNVLNSLHRANAARWNVHLAQSTRTKRPIPCPIPPAAAGAESAWVPVLNGLSPSRITRLE